MKFTNLTRKNEIGANSYYLEINGHGYVLDAGSHPKIEGREGLPRFNLLAQKPVNGVFVSHSHLDHIGALPVLLEDHPEAKAYMTHASCLITDRALHNSANVMAKQRTELNLPEYPLFTHRQVDRLVDEFEGVPYGRSFEVEGAHVAFHEAGHVQGAAGIWIQSEKTSVFYTGDTKFSDMRITRGAQFPDSRPDVLIMECTRGSTPSQPHSSWEEEIDRLAKSIQETYEKGGSVLIPCFALGKTQEVLKVLHDLIHNGLLPRQPIYISGLANSYNEIYDELAHIHPRVCPGFKLEKSMDLVVLEQRAAAKMQLGKGKLFLLSSGMMTPHTSSYKMAVKMAHDPKHSIFFVGYADPDSPAGKVKVAGQGGKADFGGEVGMMDLQCRVDSFDLTSHCNREHMLDYVMRVRPHQVLLVHGETNSLQWFEQEIKKQIPDCKVTIPPSGETIELG